jgi:hypothetical protein
VSPFPASFWLVKTIKTGGTTIASVLRQLCGQYGVVPVNKRRINPLEQMPDAQAAAALHGLVQGARNATDASEFAIITHLNFSHAKLAAFQSALDGRRPLLFTAVRHPLSRTYSHFIQAKCANAAAILGGKIIECDTNTTFMAKLLELDNVRNRWSFVKVPSRHNLVFNYIRGNATTAEAALKPYDFVFVSERMDEGDPSTQQHRTHFDRQEPSWRVCLPIQLPHTPVIVAAVTGQGVSLTFSAQCKLCRARAMHINSAVWRAGGVCCTHIVRCCSNHLQHYSPCAAHEMCLRVCSFIASCQCCIHQLKALSTLPFAALCCPVHCRRPTFHPAHQA